MKTLESNLKLITCAGLMCLGTSARADYESTVQALSPLGYWRLNETAPSVDPAISINSILGGAALNGAYINFPTRAVAGALAGSSDTAVSFNGSSQNIDIPYSAQLNTTIFSAEIWVNPASLSQPSGTAAVMSSGQPAATNRSGWVLYLNGNLWSFRPFKNSGILTVTGDANGINSAANTAVAGAWHHLVVVNDGTKCKLYVNGALANEIEPLPANAYVAATSGGTTIGKRYSSANQFYGTLDEAAFYTTALSAQDVLDHYNNGLDAGRNTPYETLVGASSPVGYYRMDEPVFVPPIAANIGTLGALADGAYGTGSFTNAAGPTSMPGLGGGNVACRFDGTGQINCGSDTGLDVSAISVAAWIKPGGVITNMSVLAKGSLLWRLQLDGVTNHLKWVYADTSNGSAFITGSKNVTDGSWHHVVAVAGANGSALYVDGVLDASDPTAVTLPTTMDPVTIGSQNTTSSRWLGSLDEVSLFGTELTESQVVALYLAAEPPTKDMYTFGPGAVIAGTDITWTLPMGTDVANLTPTFTYSFQATCDKTSGATEDFSNPVTYTITGLGDPLPKVYTVTVVLAKVPILNGMTCWYDAAVGVTTDGSGVQTWNDRSGQEHHATRASSGSPTLVPNDINSTMPAVHIRGNQQWLDCAGKFFTKEQYVVVRSPNANWNGSGSFLGRKNMTGQFLEARPSSYNLGNGTTRFWQDWIPAAVSKNGTAVPDDRANSVGFRLGTITDYMILKIVVLDANPTIGSAYYQIGENDNLGSCDMDIAEIIGYSTPNSHCLKARLVIMCPGARMISRRRWTTSSAA